ncbi:MAG: hypothetical protein WC666_01240 [Candidatus Paceibacterota bacterium]|jgi:hypothetical protein
MKNKISAEEICTLYRYGMLKKLVDSWKSHMIVEINPVEKLEQLTKMFYTSLVCSFISITGCSITQEFLLQNKSYGSEYAIFLMNIVGGLFLGIMITSNITTIGCYFLILFNGFVKDLNKLFELLDNPDPQDLVDYSKVKAKAADYLNRCGKSISLAESNITSEYQGMGSDLAEEFRKDFKRSHSVFLRFNLVEGRWNSYFPKNDKVTSDTVKSFS